MRVTAPQSHVTVLVEDGVELCFEEIHQGTVRRCFERGQLKIIVGASTWDFFINAEQLVGLELRSDHTVRKKYSYELPWTLDHWYAQSGYHAGKWVVSWRETWRDKAKEMAVHVMFLLGRMGVDRHVKRAVVKRIAQTYANERWKEKE